MNEGSGSGARSGCIPLTNGSGSKRPRNTWSGGSGSEFGSGKVESQQYALLHYKCLTPYLESMKRALVEFEIDLTKMPLGKLSKSQIQQERNLLITEYDSQNFAPFLDLFKFFLLILIPGSIVSISQSQVSDQSLCCLKTLGKNKV
jgi:hypothetical protein